MDVKLPNGKIIRGVPKGTPKDVIARKAIAAGLATEKDFNMAMPVKTGVDPDVPTPENLALSEAQAPKELGIFDQIKGIGETLLSLGSSATTGQLANVAASPIAAIGELTGKFAPATSDNPLTAKPSESEQFVQKAVSSATYQPKTEAGQRMVSAVGESLEALPPVSGLGATANVGSLVQSLKKPLPRSARKALSEVAPTIDQLKDAATALYKEVDDAGIKVGRNDYQNFAITLNNKLRKSGLDQDLTPKTAAVLNRIQRDFKEGNLKLTDLEQVRKLADVPAKQFDNPTEQRLASIIKESIDDFVDVEASKNQTQTGNVGDLYRGARNLTQRRKKLEMFEEAITRSEQAASGFENGLRNEFRSILKNKKKRRGFTPEELSAMNQITQGGKLENTFKKLGKLGFGADQQTNMLLGVLGSTLGATIGGSVGGGAGAGVGALTLPAIGQVAANISKRLGQRNQKYLSDITAAGKNGGAIIEAYIKNVPRKNQSKQELAALLLDPNVDMSTVKDIASKYKAAGTTIDDAIFIADRLKNAQLAAYAAQLGQEQANDEGEN